MSRAAQGIRFVDTGYQERFRIADGDQIRVTLPDGESRDSICRFIDENHVELQYGFFGSDSIYHVLEFAERVERSRLTVIPLRSSLPKQCYSVLPASGELIVVTKGDSGYLPANAKALDCSNREGADQLNRAMGVTKAQEAAMVAGSMFGWAAPAADPSRYDDEGNPIRPGGRRFGEKLADAEAQAQSIQQSHAAPLPQHNMER